MSKTSLAKNLETLFWVVGWLQIAFAVIYLVVRPYQELAWINSGQSHFSLIEEFQRLAGSIGQSFFLLLISRVLGMVFSGQPKYSAQTYRFMQITCIGFTAKCVLGMVSYLSLFRSLEGGWVTMLSMGFSSYERLMPAFYAASIFVLYRRFAEMITFESEVA